MKILQSFSSYVLGFLAFFAPQITDTLENKLQEVIASMRAEGLENAANAIIQNQEHYAEMNELEMFIKLVGVMVSIIVAVLLFLKDIESIYAGFSFLTQKICLLFNALLKWLKKQYTKISLGVSFFFNSIKKRIKYLFSKNKN